MRAQLASIFTNQAGDWKLGGLESVADPRGAAGAAAFAAVKEVLARKLQPPELARGQLDVLAAAHHGALDAWLLGVTIYEVFNGALERPEQLMNLAQIPPALAGEYTRLLSGAVAGRLGADGLLRSPFFASDYCALCEFLETLNVQEPAAKEVFFARLTGQVATLPPAAAKYKVRAEARDWLAALAGRGWTGSAGWRRVRVLWAGWLDGRLRSACVGFGALRRAAPRRQSQA